MKNKLDTEIPVLGEIPLTNQTLIQENIRGSLVESFRLIRTNLNYILPKNESGKVILVTSSIKGEGKTFAAINLAQSISSIKKNKVLVIGIDLRNPQIHRYINQDKDSIIGLTNYLNEKDIDYKEIITNSPDLNFDFILSGPIPPNAAEILLNSKLGLLIEKVKKDYDFVILDSAPCLLVSDTLGIMNLVDSTLYLTKANHTDLKLIEYINHLSSDKIIKNLSVVLNGVSTEGMQYNYGYGYGYDKEV